MMTARRPHVLFLGAGLAPRLYFTDESSAAQLWSVTLRIYIRRWLYSCCLCPRRWRTENGRRVWTAPRRAIARAFAGALSHSAARLTAAQHRRGSTVWPVGSPTDTVGLSSATVLALVCSSSGRLPFSCLSSFQCAVGNKKFLVTAYSCASC